MSPRVVLATRRSPLALAQTHWVADRLREQGYDVALLELVTTGDRWSAAGGGDATRGLFVKELEEALLDGRADLAVHSAKDVPGDMPPGLGIVAVPQRADARDVVVGPPGGLGALPAGARVGTGSPRRVAQARRLRPDLEYAEIRGNVGTRLEKLDRGDYDAVILAAAGLARLGLAPRTVTPLDIGDCVPAPGQGALALEGRLDRPEIAAAAATIDVPRIAACVALERAVLAGLGGGCREPVGAHAVPDGEGLRLEVFAAAHDESRSVRRTLAASPDGGLPGMQALLSEVAAGIAVE